MKNKQRIPKQTEKMLSNIIRARRWLFTGGIIAAIQALFTAFDRPEAQGTLILQSLLAAGCIGYGLSLTSRIRKMNGNAGQ